MLNKFGLGLAVSLTVYLRISFHCRNPISGLKFLPMSVNEASEENLSVPQEKLIKPFGVFALKTGGLRLGEIAIDINIIIKRK